jgi:hypothetical protein
LPILIGTPRAEEAGSAPPAQEAGASAEAAPAAVVAATEVFLGQNDPNPFAASTAIRFVLPERLAVSLSVFDIGGRRVQTLAQGELEAGEYTVHWDGRDFTGEPVPAGIYFYRLEGTDIDEIRKLVVLR